jgi:hypothetical protein
MDKAVYCKWTRVVTQLGTEAYNSALSNTDTMSEHYYTSSAPTYLRDINRHNFILTHSVIFNYMT